jgi:hypothetical protein
LRKCSRITSLNKNETSGAEKTTCNVELARQNRSDYYAAGSGWRVDKSFVSVFLTGPRDGSILLTGVGLGI